MPSVYRQLRKLKECRLSSALAASLFGIALAVLCPTYPNTVALLVAFSGIGLVCVYLRLWLVLIGACSFFCFAAAINKQLAQRWPLEDWNAQADLRVRISNFARESPGRIQFDVKVLSDGNWPDRIRVAWYRTEQRPQLGEIWQLRLRLRAPRGLANPHSFDFERWLFAKGIGASAYVRDSDENARLHETPKMSIAMMRRQLVDRISRSLPADAASSVLVALAVGSRHSMSADTREQMVRTGTLHLMAISGLHIGLAAGIGVLIGRLLLALAAMAGSGRRLIYLPACIGMSAAVAYAALAGFSVPTQRALAMLCLALPLISAGRMVATVKLLALAALLVLIVHPASVLGVSFHLTFCIVAVLILIATLDRLRYSTPDRPGAKTLRWQFWLCCLSLPLNLVLFGRVSLIAPLANLLAVPVFSFGVVPGLFYGLSALPGADASLLMAHALANASLFALEFLGRHEAASVFTPALSLPEVLLILLALFLFALPGPIARRLPFIALSIVLAVSPKRVLAKACYQLQVFDVGQGQAILIRTASNALLFDTGPGFGNGASAASGHILPALRAQNIAQLERVIVSHGDLDHRGGLKDILQAMPGTPVYYSGDKALFPGDAIACQAGMQWELDGVPFAFLHPDDSRRGNNGSCVLKVGKNQSASLLTGDIERVGERELLRRYATALKSQVVSVPHHGSETSSTQEFVEAVGARFALVSAGYQNRWKFPRDTVVRRWQASGSTVLNVAEYGSIHVKVCPSLEPDIEAFRAAEPRFWRYRAP